MCIALYLSEFTVKYPSKTSSELKIKQRENSNYNQTKANCHAPVTPGDTESEENFDTITNAAIYISRCFQQFDYTTDWIKTSPEGVTHSSFKLKILEFKPTIKTFS